MSTLQANLLRAIAVALGLIVGGGAFAQSSSITGLSTARALDEDDKQRIAGYAEHWGEELMQSGDQPAEVYVIRRRLLDPVSAPGVTEIFRTTYGARIVPLMVRAIDEGSPHLSVNAAIVLSRVGTERALEALLDRVALRDEPRMHVRVAAARGVLLFLDDIRAERIDVVIKPKRITAGARTMAAAAREETAPPALRYQLSAILAAAEVAPPESKDQLLGYLVETIEAAANRAAAAGIDENPIGTLAAVYPVLSEVRVAFLKLDPREQRDYGRRLAPAVRRLLDVADAHWNEAQKRPDGTGQPEKIILLCERFLATIDTFVRGTSGVRPPETGLAEAWRAGDADRYRADLQRWTEVLQNPPY